MADQTDSLTLNEEKLDYEVDEGEFHEFLLFSPSFFIHMQYLVFPRARITRGVRTICVCVHGISHSNLRPRGSSYIVTEGIYLRQNFLISYTLHFDQLN